jgi:carbon storage regulator
MIKLTRKAGEAVMIGSNVNITVLTVKDNQVEIGIDTPKEIAVYWVEVENDPQQDDGLSEGVGVV